MPDATSTTTTWSPMAATASALATAERVVSAVNASHRAAVERLLAIARFSAAVIQAIALALPTGPLHFQVAHYLASAYAIWAGALLVSTWRRSKLRPETTEAYHITDLASTAVVSALSGGVSSQSYPLFALVLISAGYRWGLRRTIIDGVLIVAIAAVESAMSLAGLTPWPFEGDMFLLRVGYIVVLALLFGVLSEGQLALRFQALAVGGLMTRLSHSTLVLPALRSFLGELVQVFDASHVALAIHERDAASPTLWLSSRTAHGTTITRRSLSAAERGTWLHPLPSEVGAYQMRRRPGTVRPVVSIALERAGDRSPVLPDVPMDLVPGVEWHTALVALVDFAEPWGARLYVFDPGLRPGGLVRLGFLQNLAEQNRATLAELLLASSAAFRRRHSGTRTGRPRTARRRHPDAARPRAPARGPPAQTRVGAGPGAGGHGTPVGGARRHP